MASSGGHWIKSPFGGSVGSSAFMPMDIHEAPGAYGMNWTATLGDYKMVEEGDGQTIYKDGELVGTVSNYMDGILAMAAFKATGIKKAEEINKQPIYQEAKEIMKYQGVDMSNTDTHEIYGSFLSYLKAYTANPSGNVIWKNPPKEPEPSAPSGGGLFED